jgi:hypothetical protein
VSEWKNFYADKIKSEEELKSFYIFFLNVMPKTVMIEGWKRG